MVDIARMMRSIKFTRAIGGYCLLRAGSGTLGLLGLKTQFCVVGMLYRARPDPLRGHGGVLWTGQHGADDR